MEIVRQPSNYSNGRLAVTKAGQKGRETTMLMAIAVVGVGIGALAALAAQDARSARDRDSNAAMESVLCSGSSCDIQARISET